MGLFGRKSGRKGFEQLDASVRAITFYAEDRGSWPHFAPIVDVLTREMGREIAYLTSDPADPVLAGAHPGVHAFEIGEGTGRTFLFKSMAAGVVVATVPQLGIPLLPRSQRAAAIGMQYVYVFHSLASTHMIYEPDGFDHFDTVLCTGPYMEAEIRRRETMHGLAAKELLPHGYGRLDTLLRTAGSPPPLAAGERATVLVAPSWGPTCIFETCGTEVVAALLDAGHPVIARPHPMTRKRTPAALTRLQERFASHPGFRYDDDIAGFDSLQASHVMVSDWSGAALEYAFAYERPVVFVDVERKVNNPRWADLGIEPFEAWVRPEIGRVVAPGDLTTLPEAIREVTAHPEAFADRIRAVRDQHVFNVGTSGTVAAGVIAAKADRIAPRLAAS